MGDGLQGASAGPSRCVELSRAAVQWSRPAFTLHCGDDKPSVVQLNTRLASRGSRGRCHTDLVAGPATCPQAAHYPPGPQLPSWEVGTALILPVDIKPWI